MTIIQTLSLFLIGVMLLGITLLEFTEEAMRKPTFIFKPVISKAQMLLQAMMAAMLPKTPDDNLDEFPTGSGYGSSGHDKTPHISEVANLSKQERRKRERIHRLSTRKKR